jgi:hypothetical protein
MNGETMKENKVRGMFKLIAAYAEDCLSRIDLR